MVNLAKTLCSLLQGDAIHFKIDNKLSPFASIPPGSVRLFFFFCLSCRNLINPVGIFSIRVASKHFSHVS